jgi:hypothetical protein
MSSLLLARLSGMCWQEVAGATSGGSVEGDNVLQRIRRMCAKAIQYLGNRAGDIKKANLAI